ncbi:UPF0764 protein C16orf89 homolog [Anomaloglossus baeobatrachus]|uniref:UPF0764 protein C16orf89 homolog n=1 Tax=Anomaloglossus baeobatrachus TaxID=238106 RepID=UPI003F4F7E19
MRLLLLLIPLALFTPCMTNNETVVRRAISAIWKSVLLLKNEYEEFNLDGVTGFRILLELIKGTIERFDAVKDPYACFLMKRLTNILTEMVDKASYFTKLRDSKYFEEFQDLSGDHFWILPTSWNQTIPGLVYRESIPDESLCLKEQFSDECISSLLGNLKEELEPCIVTAPCTTMMNHKGCTGYSLSHQLLYIIVGKMKRCRNDLFVKDFGYYTNVFCSNMMKSNIEIQHSGFPLHSQDLFMENIMLCGLCGYSDFYKQEWMNKIISWQDPIIGCFGNIENAINHSPKRVKRRERIFLDVCLSHKTAVAVGALGGFLYSSTFTNLIL